MPVPLPPNVTAHPTVAQLLPRAVLERLAADGDEPAAEIDDRQASREAVSAALAQLATEEPAPVLELLDRAVALWPENAAGWIAKGWVYECLGRSGSALACYNRVLLDLQTEGAFLLERKAECLQARGQAEAASLCRSRAARLRTDE